MQRDNKDALTYLPLNIKGLGQLLNNEVGGIPLLFIGRSRAKARATPKIKVKKFSLESPEKLAQFSND